jgi:hypothetical protein
VTFSNNNQLFRCVIGVGFCSETPRDALLIVDKDASLTTNELEVFTLYPNPTTETISIERISEMIIDYAITDMTGRVVATGRIDSLKSEVNVSQLEAGSYQFSLEGSKPSTFVKTK